MNLEQELIKRSNSKCELCSNDKIKLQVYEIPPYSDENVNKCILLCNICLEQIQNEEKIEVNHWRCLNDSMWSEIPAVQVMAWRMLTRLRSEGWTQDLLDMLYLEDDILAWAKLPLEQTIEQKHKDCNGNELKNGDTVTLIKNLVVKGANFTAKRGTAVRKILLVEDNHEHIEGKVEGQKIVIITKFVKKTN